MPTLTGSSASWVERQVSQLGTVWADLRVIQAELAGYGDVNSAIKLVRLLKPSEDHPLNQLMKRFEPLEERLHKKIDWTNLEEWIKNAQNQLREEVERLAWMYQLLKINFSELGLEDAHTELLEHPLWRSLDRLYGSNWQTRSSEIHRAMGIDLTSSNSIPMDREQFWRAVSRREKQVLQELNKLERKQEYLPAFRRSWAGLSTDARKQILLKYQLPRIQNAHIYAYLKGPEDGRSTALHPYQPFNCVDLLESDVLPSLLETRCRVPPQHFLRLDGRYSALGVLAGRNTPIAVEGVLFLKLHNGSSGEAGARWVYGDTVSELADHGALTCVNASVIAPGVFFWQLEAQEKVYRFLGCLADTINNTSNAQMGDEPFPVDDGDAERNPLIDRFSRPNYLSHTMSINPEDMRDVIRTSLDEAMDHLLQARQDADAWHSGMKGLAKPSGKKELLTILFGRIDILSALDQSIGTAIQQARTPLLSEADDDIQIAASLDIALCAAFGERLLHFRWIKPPPQRTLTTVGHRLLEMIIQDDPVLRCMGFSEVMKTVEREAYGTTSFPIAVSQTLSDLHVMAVCLGEISSHLPSISDWVQYSRVADSLHAGQTGRRRPWLEILDKTVEAMENADEFNLTEGHRVFWQRLDQQMAKVSQNDQSLEDIFRKIEQTMPLGSEQPVSEVPTDALVSIFRKAPGTAATATQLKRTRRRGGRHQTPNPSRPTGQSTQRPLCSSFPRHLPHTQLGESDFWLSLQDGTQQTFSWDDLCKAMCSLGCSMEPAGGSAVRFVLRNSKGQRDFSIVYHKPHNESGETTLNLGQARRCWLKRLEKCINRDRTEAT
ncbi:hypothetical protein CLIM01_14640 [Colletotrichum limetticola]|uniref:Uncharacterized protein n=1 Tax=Colletotrichum limetticola TaxID=1209924 RepID=A0ABQ9P7B5_9PEZI|nr:hypothetical protein CLIM01_14640 [Colletotrichum limetticola]